MQELTIPASYDVWLTDLKHYLDRGRGRQAELARHLAKVRDLKLKGASVSLLKFLRGDARPGVDLFLDMAAWLQQQQDGQSEITRLERADEPEPIGPRREVTYTTGSTRRPKVADE